MIDVLTGLDGVNWDLLDDASVLIAGVGNIGSPLASYLAGSGIRRLILLDRDRVEAKNLHTQDYRPEDVGRAKAEALADRLRTRFPDVAIEAITANLEDVPLGRFAVELILGALDSRRARQLLISEIAWPLGIAVVDGGVGEGWRGRVQTFVPGRDAACLECTWGREDYRQLTVEYPCVPGAGASAPATVSPAFAGAAAAAVMTAEAIRLLTGATEKTNQETTFDLFHRRWMVTRLRRATSCRFDHEIVAATWTLCKSIEQARVADLLDVIRENIGDASRVHLETRRVVDAGGGFGPTRLRTLDELRKHAAEPLTTLGLTPEDRPRVRWPGGSAFVLLGGS
jgi:molybdopterin/thiamine biosynthesis adenylyltransferase